MPKKLECHFLLPTFILSEYTVLPWPYYASNLIRRRYLIKALTLDKLARKIKVDTRALHHTVESCNEYARTGYDVEFNRGGNSYDNFYGDLAGRKAPFYAHRWIYPGNVSTMWGLVTNKAAQVMDRNGEPIPGLYAIGCDQNSVFRFCSRVEDRTPDRE